MKPLHEDQIHSPAFQKISDFIWSANKSEEYILSVIRDINPNLKVINKHSPPLKGVLFVGMNQLIEDVFDQISREGSYIIICAPQDRSFTEAFYKRKPKSVKHIYTTNCQVKADDVTAIPMGIATITGECQTLKQVAQEEVKKAETLVFVRYNVNNSGYTEERKASLPILKSKSFCKVVEEQIPQDEFLREIKAHKFTMALKGQGKDAARQWEAVTLGSIPILTDCIEMRFFEDMPVVYCPNDVNNLTEEYLENQKVGTNTDKIRFSYWESHIKKMRDDLRI